MPSETKPSTRPEPRTIDTASLLGRLAQLRQSDNQAQVIDPPWLPLLLGAATQLEFDADQLLSCFDHAANSANRQRLWRHAEAVRSDERATVEAELPPAPWRLTATERGRVLAASPGIVALHEARRRLPEAANVEQRVADAMLFGTLGDVSSLSIGEIAAAIEACNWYDGSLPELPSEATLRARLALAQLLEPLRRLIGRHFVGREAELSRLADYVGVLGPQKVAGSQLLGLGLRVLRRTRRSLIDNPPLYISGPGGVGKSSLLARFILDHLDAPQQGALPFVLLDFDRAQVEARLPLSLLVAALHQLRVQFPAHVGAMQRMAEHLMQVMRSTDEVELSKGDSSQKTQVRDFADQLDDMLGGGNDATPLLWVLDTFEEPQRLGDSTVGPLWELMNTLQEALPRLRLVVCGRVVPAGFHWDVVPLDDFDELSAKAYLRWRLSEVKPEHPADDGYLEKVIKVVGRTPLALRLAARLLAADDDQLLNLKLRRERIQAVLFHRVLDHIRVDGRLMSKLGAQFVDDDERRLLEQELVRLVYPGLAVRRITPGVIQHVLAKACGVVLRDEGHAARLFGALAQQVDIVEPGDADNGEPSLLHRTDVRRMMLRDLELKAGEQVIRRIDTRAVRYHAGIATLPHCAEEIYHRLRLRQNEATIRARWKEGIERYLLPALDEIASPATRVLLADLLDVTLDSAALEGAEQDAWERQATRRASDYLRASNPERALSVLAERAERTTASPLLRLEAQARQQLGQFRAAADMAERALTEAAESGEQAAAADAALLWAQADEALNRLDSAVARTQEARDWADQLGDIYLLLRALATSMRLARKRHAKADELEVQTQYVGALLDSDTLRGLRTRPALLRELLAEKGAGHLGLLRLGLDLLGVDLPSLDDAAQLAQTLMLWSGAPEGDAVLLDVALAHGVRVRSGAGRLTPKEWTDWLWRASPKDVGNLLLDLLKQLPPPPTVLTRLASLFRLDVERRIARGTRQRTV